MAKKKGNEELLYIASSAPTTANDKDDAAYSLLTYVTSWSMSVEGDEIDGSDKDSGAWGDPFVGTKNATLEASFNRDFVAATAQTTVETAALATTAATQQVWWIKTTGVASDIGRHGTGRVLSLNLGSDHNDIGKASISIKNIGAYTVFTES